MKNLFLTLLFLSPLMLLSQSYFSKSYNMIASESGRAGNVEVLDDGYIIGGISSCNNQSCSALKKINLAGDEMWHTIITCDNYNIEISDFGKGMILNEAENIVCFGQKYMNQNSDWNLFLVELDHETGDTLNFEVYIDNELQDGPIGIVQNHVGEYLLYASESMLTPDTFIYHRKVVVINEDFTYQQDIVLNDPIDFIRYGNIILSGEDHFIVAAQFKENTAAHRPVLHRYDYDGNWEWRRWFSPMNDSDAVKVTTRPGGFYLTNAGENNNPDKPGWIMPRISGTDEAGNMLWSSFICTEALMKINDLVTAPNGDLLVCGLSAEESGAPFVLRMSPNGEELWRKHISDTRNTTPQWQGWSFRDIEVKGNGDIVLSGSIVDTIGTGGLFPEVKGWLVVLDENGCIEPDCEDNVFLTSTKEVAQTITDVEQYFSFYPNPVKDEINISMWFVQPSVEAFELYDLNGKLLSRHKLNLGLPTHQINLGSLNSGK